MVQRLEQLGIDDVRLDLVGDEVEQRAQALARIGDRFELAEHGFLLDLFPALQRRDQQRIARREVPVEAALGHAEPARERFHRDRGDALFGDQIERGLRPVVGAEASAAFGLVGLGGSGGGLGVGGRRVERGLGLVRGGLVHG